jgi:hypothetical protein
MGDVDRLTADRQVRTWAVIAGHHLHLPVAS